MRTSSKPCELYGVFDAADLKVGTRPPWQPKKCHNPGSRRGEGLAAAAIILTYKQLEAGMKSVNLLGIAGVVLGFASLAFAQAPAVELKVGDKAPNFKLQASDGKTYNLADFTGKKAVVVAWFPA